MLGRAVTGSALGLDHRLGSAGGFYSGGESTWIEGAALVGLYIVIAAGFWWG